MAIPTNDVSTRITAPFDRIRAFGRLLTRNRILAASEFLLTPGTVPIPVAIDVDHSSPRDRPATRRRPVRPGRAAFPSTRTHQHDPSLVSSRRSPRPPPRSGRLDEPPGFRKAKSVGCTFTKWTVATLSRANPAASPNVANVANVRWTGEGSERDDKPSQACPLAAALNRPRGSSSHPAPSGCFLTRLVPTVLGQSMGVIALIVFNVSDAGRVLLPQLGQTCPITTGRPSCPPARWCPAWSASRGPAPRARRSHASS